MFESHVIIRNVMKKYCVGLIMLNFAGCKKQVNDQQLQYVLTPVPSCDDHPLFCEDEFDDLPESNEDTGDIDSENIRTPSKPRDNSN